jgi:hypothetical protein
MKRVYLTLASLVAPLVVVACASHSAPRAAATPPATRPVVVLPEPIIPVLAAQAVEPEVAAPTTQALPPVTQTLPTGHPDISQMKSGGMPGGMGAMGGAGGMPAMPAGHPDISKLKTSASTQPVMIGSISVRAVQGTPSGPAIGELPVVVELYQGENAIDKREAKLAADGTATLDAIPVGLGVTPVVRVTYKGVDYTTTGGQMDGQHPEQQIQVPVFETTEEQPAWTVHMQHVMLQPTTEGVGVMEMLAIENPSDKSWLGKLGPDNKRTTLVFSLPPGAKDVQLVGGFHECCVKIEGEKIINSMAFVPGVSQYRIAYTLPVGAGKAEFSLTTAAPVKHLMIFVPDDRSTVSAEGIASGGSADMGNGKTRFYKAADLAAGAVVKLNLTGITAAPTPAAAATELPAGHPAASANESGQAAKLVAGAGGLMIFVVGGFLVFLKAPKSSKKARA